MYNYNVWETQDGRMLKLSEMTKHHIQNCIDMLTRQIREIQDELYVNAMEISPDVEMAITFRRKYIESFKKELQKRVDKTNAICYNNYSKKSTNNINPKGGNYMETNGSIGGLMIKKMIEAQERQMQIQKAAAMARNSSKQENKEGDNTVKSKKIRVQIDGFDRIMLPTDVCKALDLQRDDDLEISITKNGIELRKDMTAARERLIARILREVPQDVSFIKYGDTTICLRKEPRGNGVAAKTGAAICSPTDKWNGDLGRAIAYLRMKGKNVPEILTN